MLTYDWKIENLERRAAGGFITTAHWRVNATDGERTATAYGSCGWSEGEPVIPFQEVTPAEVLAWCWNHGVDKDQIEENLAAQIEQLQNPPVLSGVPWGN